MGEGDRARDRHRWLIAFADRKESALPDLSTLDVAACPDDALEAARLVWRRRVMNEALSVDLAQHLRRTAGNLDRASETVAHALARLEADEARHVMLASAVSARLGVTSTNEPASSSLPALDERAELAFLRLVLTALCVCESVSAARFAAVREHTDLAPFRACIEAFHRDELTHAELGFQLLPDAIERARAAIGREAAHALVLDELRGTMGHLDRVIGLDLERQGPLPQARAQPQDNPGVVEPIVDAIAFYRALHDDVVPRLEALGLPAARAWKARR